MTDIIQIDLLDDTKDGNSKFLKLLDFNNWSDILNRFENGESPTELVKELIDGKQSTSL